MSLPVQYIIIADRSCSSCEYMKEDDQWVKTGKYGAWGETKIHSFHANREDAELALGKLTPDIKHRLADPKDPKSPVDFSEGTSYRIVDLEELNKLLPRY